MAILTDGVKTIYGNKLTIGTGLNLSESEDGLPILHWGNVTGVPTGNSTATSHRAVVLNATYGAGMRLPGVPTTWTVWETRQQVKYDVTPFTQVRTVVDVDDPGNSGSGVLAEFSLDGGLSWASMSVDDTLAPLNVVGTQASPWGRMRSACTGDVLIRWGTLGGDGVSAPRIGNCGIEFRYSGARSELRQLRGGATCYSSNAAWDADWTKFSTSGAAIGITSVSDADPLPPIVGDDFSSYSDTADMRTVWSMIGAEQFASTSGPDLSSDSIVFSYAKTFVYPNHADIYVTRTFTGLPPGQVVRVSAEGRFSILSGTATQTVHQLRVGSRSVAVTTVNTWVPLVLTATVPENGELEIQFGAYDTPAQADGRSMAFRNVVISPAPDSGVCTSLLSFDAAGYGGDVYYEKVFSGFTPGDAVTVTADLRKTSGYDLSWLNVLAVSGGAGFSYVGAGESMATTFTASVLVGVGSAGEITVRIGAWNMGAIPNGLITISNLQFWEEV